MCAQQSATAPTDNFALLHCTFQQGTAFPLTVDVCALTSNFNNLQHRPNSTLLHYYNQQQHHLASRHSPPPPHFKVARAVRFSSITRSYNTPTLASPPRPVGTAVLQLCATPRPNAAPLNNWSPSRRVCSSTQLQFATSVKQICAPLPLRPQQRHPLDDTQQHRLATRSTADQSLLRHFIIVASARLSRHQELHPSTYPPPTLASASIVRARTPSPTTISSSIVGHNSSPPTVGVPILHLLSVKHATGECSCTVLQ